MALLQYDEEAKRRQDESPDAPILQLQGVCKSFALKPNTGSLRGGSGVEEDHAVLDGLDLRINKGEFVTIVGPSGCGKSTLLNIIAGLERPDSGDLVVKGDVISPTKRIMIFQEGALFPWLTARENVEFGLKIANMAAADRHRTVAKYIELVGLTKFSDSYVHQLSGGMKQRVAIARALAMQPEILLMDEPFAALDIQTRDLLQDELVGVHKATGVTILFVTHNINEALLLGDRVIVMSSARKKIRKEFVIGSQRPRDPEGQELHEVKRLILAEFEEYLQVAKGTRR